MGTSSLGGARAGAGMEGFDQAVVQIEGRLKGNDVQLRDSLRLRGDGCKVAASAEVVFVTGFEQREQPSGIHGRDGGQIDHEMGVVIASRPDECVTEDRHRVRVHRAGHSAHCYVGLGLGQYRCDGRRLRGTR